MRRYFNRLWLALMPLLLAAGFGLSSLSASAHPGHGKSFGTAEEPTALLWVWLVVLGIAMAAGIWRLYRVLFGAKPKTESESN